MDSKDNVRKLNEELNKAIERMDLDAVKTIGQCLSLVPKNLLASVTNPIKPKFKTLLIGRITKKAVRKTGLCYEVDEIKSIIAMINMAQLTNQEVSELLEDFLLFCADGGATVEALTLLEPYMH